jgi:uncharacterized protein (DUF1330 family)
MLLRIETQQAELKLKRPVRCLFICRRTRETAGKHALKPLVVYGKVEALEGEMPDGVTVLEFPTVEEARAWYNSPDCQAALPYRLKAANYRAFIVEGL